MVKLLWRRRSKVVEGGQGIHLNSGEMGEVRVSDRLVASLCGCEETHGGGVRVRN